MDANVATDAYRRALAAAGETVTIRRPGAPNTDVSVLARLTGFSAEQLVGNVEEGERRAIVLAADLAASAFPLPIRANRDQLLWTGPDGVTHASLITAIDDDSRRVAGVTIAYDLTLAGA